MDESTGFGSGACYVMVDGTKHFFPHGVVAEVSYGPYSRKLWDTSERKQQKPKVERVIFNTPATIVFWNDGTKTVVKCQECPEALSDCQLVRCEDGTCLLNMQFKSKGLAHAMLKKTLPGYLDTFKKLGLNL